MGSIISGISSLIGGNTASRYDKSASDTAKEAYSYARSDLSPYTSAGQSVLSDLVSSATGGLTGGQTNYVTTASQNLPGTMSESQLEQTPGYQWQLGQGLKSTQSSAAARGLGVSGASLKGAATYATGLADANYQNQFNNQQTNFQDYLNLNTAQQGQLTNQYNRLSGVATLGEQAGAATAQAGSQAASTSATALTNAGNALSQGYKGLGTGIENALNDYLGYNYGSTGGYAAGGGGGSSSG